MNSFNFQIVPVANLAAIVTPFPDHICYFTEDTENYYIWENDALKEIFVDASSITWNNITNKPTTITGYGITDAVKVNNGTLNYLAKFTPDGTTIGDSLLRDNGTSMAVGDAPSSSNLFTIKATNHWFALDVTNSRNQVGGSNYGIHSIVTGTSNINIGTQGWATNAATRNIGGDFFARGGGSVTNWGISADAANGQFNYAARLVDGTEGVVGRYLRNMTTAGEANWANINITEVTNGLSSTLLGAPNGIATLDSNSKLVMSQMPISVMDYKGTYDIVTNTPNLQDGVGNQGDVYVATTAGTRTFGVGNTLTVSVGDWLIYNGTKWEKTLGNNVGSGTVSSVGLSLGTTGTDVNVSNSPITSSGNINLNIPTASSTARGLLSTADWTTFNSKVSASLNTSNFVARFVGANLIGNGCIQDIGTNVSIGNAIPSTSIKLLVANNGAEDAIKGYTNASGKVGVYGVNDGSNSGNNTGVLGEASSSTANNVGVKGNGTSGVGVGIGVQGTGLGLGTSIGLSGLVLSGTNKYAIQLKDGTEGSGKFLKCVNGTEGYANWANITAADVSGAVGAVNGTNNYIAKFTPNGTTIGNSLIQDDGTSLGINTSPSSGGLVKVSSSSQGTTLLVYNTKTTANAQGIYVNVSAGDGKGGGFYLNGTSGENIALIGSATGVGATKNVGGDFIASGATNNYSIRLSDGTQAQNKFLKSVTATGEANWNYLPDTAQIMCSDLVTPITASTTLLKGFWVAPTNGRLSDIFASLLSAQQGGSVLTVQVKMNGTQIALPTFANLTTLSSTVAASNAFTKGTLFEIFVTQVGDGTAKGLLTTINYERT